MLPGRRDGRAGGADGYGHRRRFDDRKRRVRAGCGIARRPGSRREPSASPRPTPALGPAPAPASASGGSETTRCFTNSSAGTAELRFLECAQHLFGQRLQQRVVRDERRQSEAAEVGPDFPRLGEADFPGVEFEFGRAVLRAELHEFDAAAVVAQQPRQLVQIVGEETSA